ncbi:MAG: hypothetical protein AAF487_09185 [Bacteroidota bacterium]
MVRWYLVFLIGLFAVGCGVKGTDAESDQEQSSIEEVEFDQVKYDLVDLSPFGISAQIHVPNKKVTNVDPEVFVNESSGSIKVNSGNKFSLNIVETEMDKSLIISDLNDDLLFENTVIEEEEHFIKYRSQLPDGSQEFFHFCAWIEINGTKYLVENDKSQNFSDHYLNRMIKSVKSIQLNSAI